MRLGLCTVFGFSIAAVCTSAAIAQQPEARPDTALRLTLAQAVEQALARNRELLVSRREVAIARGRLRQARRYPFNPELALEGETGRGETREVPEGEERERRGVRGGKVELSQVVEVRGQRSLRIRGAEADLSKAEWGARDTERQVIAETTKAFGELLVAQERLALAREVLTLATSLKGSADELVRAGEAPEVDALRANVEVRRAVNRVTLDEAAVAAATRTLALLIGAPPGVSIRAAGPLLLEPAPGPLEELLAQARTARPDLKGVEAAIESARASLGLVEAERFVPAVTLSASYGEVVEFDSKNRIAMFGLSVPLPLWNRREGDLIAARAEIAKQEAERERILAALEKEVVSALQQLAAAQRVVDEYVQRIVPSQAESATLIQKGYRLGEFRLSEALLAQRDLFETRSAYLDAIAAYNAARAEVQRAVGARP